MTVLNPRLTKLFFVTRLTKGVVATPSLDFPNRTPYEIDFGINLYSYILKWVQSAKALRSVWRHKNMPDLKIAIFLRKIGENSKNSKFRYKSFEYENFIGLFCLYKRKMVIPTCSVSF